MLQRRGRRPAALAVVAFVVASLLLSACAIPAQPQEQTKARVVLGWLMNSQFAGTAVALDKGWYREEGIDLEIIPGGPNVDAVQVVASGSAEFAIISSTAALILARSQGIPVKAIGSVLQKHPFAFIAKGDSPINSVKDFAGKRIGIQATARPLLEAMLKKNGLTVEQVQVVIVGSDTVPLATGQVDAISGWVINAGQMQGAGPNPKTWLAFDNGAQYYAMTMMSTDPYIQKNPRLVEGFVRATMRGWEYAEKNVDEAVQITMKYGKNLNAENEKKTLLAMLPLLTSDATKANGIGWMEESIWQNSVNVMVETKQIKEPIKLSDLYTVEFVRKAHTARR